MSSDPTDQNVQHSNAGAEGLDAEAARFLASMQQRLAQVQSTSAELKQRECALAEQDRALAARKAELQNAERELAAVQGRLDAQAANINQREQALTNAAAQQQEQRAQIERAEAESAAERNRLIAEARDTQQRIEAQANARAQEIVEEAQRSRDDLTAKQAELDAKLARIQERTAEAQQAKAQAEARLAQAAERDRAIDARKEELEAAAAANTEKLAQAEAAATALAQREAKIKKAERQLAEREKAAAGLAELAARRAAEHTAAVAAVEQDRAAIEQRRVEVEGAERSARTAHEELQTRIQAAAQLKTELDRREGSVLTREQQLRAAQEELERRRVFVSQCEAQAVQLEATSRHLREQAEQIKVSSERQVSQWQDKATEAQFQADSAQQQMLKLQEQLAASQARARAMEEEMDQVKVLGINISPEAQGRVEGLTKRAETAEQRAATLQEIIDQHSDEVAKAEARFDALTRQLDEAQSTLGNTGEAHSKQLAAWQEQNEQHAARLAAAHATAQQARADADRAAAELNDVRARAAQTEERAQSLARRVADAEQNAHHTDQALRQACEQAAATAAEAARAEALAAADAQVELLKSRSELAAEESDRAQRRVAELEAQIKKRDAEVAELRAKVSVAESGVGSGEGAGDGFTVEQRRRLEAELAQREEALSVLANRLLNSEERAIAAQAHLDRLTDELADAQARAASDAHDRTDSNGAVHHNPTVEVAASDSRRRRLRRVRDLLAQEHRKVLLAKEALGRHKAEADAVLQQRARLSQMAQNLQAAENDANKARAKSGAGSVVVAAMMTLITVCGLSYLAAGVLWPSTYAARVTLAAESDGRSPTEQQNRVWVAAHERLATDLQVYTLAAENFQQRGMRELATAAAVQDRFGNSLATMTDVPGQITFELRGVGREATARELETFAGAVSAIANSRRQMRQDGLGTAVVKPAEAGKDPLDNKRQSAMYGALAAGLVASFAAGFGAYTLLARVRKPTPGADPLEAFGHAPIARLAPDRQSNAAA